MGQWYYELLNQQGKTPTEWHESTTPTEREVMENIARSRFYAEQERGDKMEKEAKGVSTSSNGRFRG